MSTSQIAALVSLPVEMVGAYLLPVATICDFGLVATALFSRMAFGSARFERAIMIYGTATRVYLTGLLLLRSADPDLRIPTLQDASLAYPVMAVVSLVALPAIAVLGMTHGPLVMGGAGVAICLAGVAATAVGRRVRMPQFGP